MLKRETQTQTIMYYSCIHKEFILKGYANKNLEKIDIENIAGCASCKSSGVCGLWIIASLTVDMQSREELEEIGLVKQYADGKIFKDLLPLSYTNHRVKKELVNEMQIALDAFWQDEYETAILLFDDIINNYGNIYHAQIGIAISHFMLQNYEQALHCVNNYNLAALSKDFTQLGGYYLQQQKGIATPVTIETIENKMNVIIASVVEDPDSLQTLELKNMVKEKFNIDFKVISEITNPKTQHEAFIYYFSKMDIEMIDLILDDNKTYQDVPKYKFIQKLAVAFDEFMDTGDTYLQQHRGECDNCNKGCKGISFIGNNSYNYMDLVIEVEDNTIKDAYECSDFKNVFENTIKNNRIYIHKFNFPDL